MKLDLGNLPPFIQSGLRAQEREIRQMVKWGLAGEAVEAARRWYPEKYPDLRLPDDANGTSDQWREYHDFAEAIMRIFEGEHPAESDLADYQAGLQRLIVAIDHFRLFSCWIANVIEMINNRHSADEEADGGVVEN